MSANKLKDNFHSNSRFPFSFFNSILIFVLFPSIILWLLEFPYVVLGVYLYIASLIFIIHKNWRINHYSFFLAGYAFFLCSFLVFQGYYLLAINFFTAFGGLIYAFSLNVRQLRGLFKFIHIYTFLIITSIFGMFWVFLGLEDFGTFNNPNGDPQYVIPFTFFGVEEFFIRPSSLYFEPGYFAFFIITFLYCRLLLGINTSFDKYIAFAGLITQSFTYIACLGLYFLVTQYLNKNKDSLSFLFIVIPFTFLVLFFKLLSKNESIKRLTPFVLRSLPMYKKSPFFSRLPFCPRFDLKPSPLIWWTLLNPKALMILKSSLFKQTTKEFL